MIKLSELQLKEIIVIDNGSRLGHITDLEIDSNQGKILAIVVVAREKKSGMFSKADELIISWDQIVRIGSDVILVKEVQQPDLYVKA
ncbi:YlmC/YmxH family sporulation protein [Oceanobacillus massiliensis]|uniref:YlmC/YmxH family sporulation protein n=1 Tax=Oceanobacillus massiliensis TaxID=1465765 RepID=UPI0002886FC8|nr:YlmC/YmxH family sporulation protein [Oceanobacillus massiliensis]